MTSNPVSARARANSGYVTPETNSASIQENVYSLTM